MDNKRVWRFNLKKPITAHIIYYIFSPTDNRGYKDSIWKSQCYLSHIFIFIPIDNSGRKDSIWHDQCYLSHLSIQTNWVGVKIWSVTENSMLLLIYLYLHTNCQYLTMNEPYTLASTLLPLSYTTFLKIFLTGSKHNTYNWITNQKPLFLAYHHISLQECLTSNNTSDWLIKCWSLAVLLLTNQQAVLTGFWNRQLSIPYRI